MKNVALFRRVILANELGNNPNLAYRFSDPDGVRTGKAGWSFGVCQFDINNNPNAIVCLRKCGFTTDEIARLKAQTADMTAMNAKLKRASALIDTFDTAQIYECLTTAMRLCMGSGIVLSDDETLLHIADYHNQFYMSRGGKMHTFLKNLGRPVKPEDILQFKLKLPWGLKRPDDVKRRYDNIRKICAEQAPAKKEGEIWGS